MKKKMITHTDEAEAAITSAKTTLVVLTALEEYMKRREKAQVRMRQRNFRKAKKLVAQLLATSTEFVEK